MGLIILLLLVGIAIAVIFVFVIIRDKNNNKSDKQSKQAEQNKQQYKSEFKKENIQNLEETSEFDKNTWKDNQWVQENLLKVITYSQYKSFSNKPGIYGITIRQKNGEKMIYVGKSVNVIQRLSYHIDKASRPHQDGDQYITNALRKKIEDNHWNYIHWEILSDKDWINKYKIDKNFTLNDALNEEERKFISLMKINEEYLGVYNKDEGGIDYH